jgi:hypothetical protein
MSRVARDASTSHFNQAAPKKLNAINYKIAMLEEPNISLPFSIVKF